MTETRLEGTYTALVTPFVDNKERSIDWPALDALIDAQIDGGITGLVPCGTTGEAPTLSREEQLEVVARTIKRANAKNPTVQVIAGVSTNATEHAVHLARDFERLGATGIMVVVPYYSRPTQDGLYVHMTTVAGEVKCPVIVYNIPGRTGSDLSVETLSRIASKAANVIGVKEATGNVLRAQQIACALGQRMSILSGDDALTLPMIAVGARGVISVTSNLLPAQVARVTKLALEGSLEAARKHHLALVPVHESMFVESNPAPVKAALWMRGKMRDVVRSPLIACSEAGRAAVARALDQYAVAERS